MLTRNVLEWNNQHKCRTHIWNIQSIFQMTGLDELCKCNLYDITNNGDFENVLKLFDTRLKANAIKLWESDVLEQPKLSTFRLLKS